MTAWHWRSDAACRDVEDPEIFWADRPQHRHADRAANDQALALCRVCPVQEACLDLALAVPPHFDRYGTFGGLSSAERDELREHDRLDYGTHDLWRWLLGGDPGTRKKRAEMRAQAIRDEAEAEARAEADA